VFVTIFFKLPCTIKHYRSNGKAQNQRIEDNLGPTPKKVLSNGARKKSEFELNKILMGRKTLLDPTESF
jgi:hypothetical protein